MLFFAFIFVRWGVVFFHAIRYKPYRFPKEKLNFFTSVVIPIVDESPELFRRVLINIARQRPSEILVVLNGPKNPGIQKLCRDLNAYLPDKMTRIQFYYTPVAGKRNAIRVAMEHVDPRSDITLLVDSDTIWTKNTLIEILKPFACDAKVGGVTTRQKILKPERKLVTMFASVLEEIRAEGTMKAMSVKGKVGCLPGRTIAFRTDLLKDVMYDFLHETFMGIHKEVSDDRSLTNLTLQKGYKTVMQDTSVVYTDAPVKWKQFVRQQFRWAAGSQYNNLRMTSWMLKNSKLMLFIYWTDMLMPMLLLSVYANMIICMVLNKLGYHIETLTYTAPWWLIIIFIWIGCILSFGSRNIKALKSLKWYYILLIPVFIIVLTVIMVPVRLLGLMRCSDNIGWGTRNLGNEDDQPENTDTAASTTEKAVSEKETEPVDQTYRAIDTEKKYCGVYCQEFGEITLFGDSVNVMAWFDQFDRPSENKISLCLDSHMYTAFISLQPTNLNMALVSDGYYDELIIGYLKLLSLGNRANTELFVRFAHEMEMNPAYGQGWYSWQTNDSAMYVNAWRYIVGLGRQYAPNVKWVWSPNRANEYTFDYYPGDAYVDYVSLTLNNTLDSRGSIKQFYENEGKRAYLERYNKPIIFGEAAEHSDSGNDEFRRQYIKGLFEYLSSYDRCAGIVFLNEDIDAGRQYMFTDCPSIVDTFISCARGYIK